MDTTTTTLPDPASADMRANLHSLIAKHGPDGLAKMTGPLDPDLLPLLEAALARHGGDPAAALGIQDPEAAAWVRSLPMSENPR
ncbi:hypothetical protein ACIA5D_36570 [Actinoplanes sp. NPDC051513]|uniref:hypothetical protein n=1 Tax=Actinoplanes sp. NPDC051513 TaxID=3363908 RepID=UPI003797EF37